MQSIEDGSVDYITNEFFLERTRVGDIAYDLKAYLPVSQEILIQPGEITTIPTGIRFSKMEGVYSKIESRSGLALRGISTRGGIIDPNYRGEVKVIIINEGKEDYTISHGDRIAQLIFSPYLTPRLTIVENLEDSVRGENGFGSSGK